MTSKYKGGDRCKALYSKTLNDDKQCIGEAVLYGYCCTHYLRMMNKKEKPQAVIQCKAMVRWNGHNRLYDKPYQCKNLCNEKYCGVHQGLINRGYEVKDYE